MPIAAAQPPGFSTAEFRFGGYFSRRAAFYLKLSDSEPRRRCPEAGHACTSFFGEIWRLWRTQFWKNTSAPQRLCARFSWEKLIPPGRRDAEA